jgi:hypothetical protein
LGGQIGLAEGLSEVEQLSGAKGLKPRLAAVALKFGADGGNFGPEIVDRRLQIVAPGAGSITAGTVAGAGLVGHGLVGAGIHLCDKLAQIHPLFGIKFAQFTQQISSGLLDVLRDQFGDGATQEKGFDEGMLFGFRAAIHKSS